MKTKLTKGEKALLLRMRDSFSLGKFKYVDTPLIGDTYLVFAADDGRVTIPEMKYLNMLVFKGYLRTITRKRCVLTDLGKQTIQELLKQQEHAK